MFSLLLPLQRGILVDVRRTIGSSQAIVRSLVLAALAISIGYAIFYFVRRSLTFLLENGAAAYIPPATTLGLILSVILGMIFISCFVSAVGTLFFSGDLSLLIAAPVRRYQFFFAKLIELTATASWLVIIFGLPALIGFWVVYGKPDGFWSAVALSMPPYFIAPAAASMMLATILAIIVPLNRTREFMVALGLVAIVGLVVLLKVTIPSPNQFKDVTVLLSLMSNVLQPPNVVNPASWTGAILGQALDGSDAVPASLFLSLSYAWCAFIVAVSFVVVGAFHGIAFSKAASLRIRRKQGSGIFERLALLVPTRDAVGQMSRKELLLFVRDPGQSMQLLILLGLCVIYLYNLRMLHAIQGLEDAMKVWWQIFLAIANAILASFVLSAMCTRLVFPSTSLEGSCWWIAQVAPVSFSNVLKAKARAWTFPVSMVSAVIFAAGSLAIGAPFIVVVTTVVAGLILAWGMVRLAVGLGAQYARFDWEHPSQLAASFGSLIFMLFSIGFIVAAMLAPATVASLSLRGTQLSAVSWVAITILSLLIEAGISWWVGTSAMRAGAKSLEQRR